MDERLIQINEAVEYLRGRFGDVKPFAGIVLGSGLGKLADRIEDPITIKYSEIPHFAISTATGQIGRASCRERV